MLKRQDAEETQDSFSREAGKRWRSWLMCSAVVVGLSLALFALQNLLIAAYFPRLTRFTSDFSPTYLQREITFIAAQPSQTIFLGDSVLWGFRVRPEEGAVALLQSRGFLCSSLSFKGSSPPNYYALSRLLLAAHIHPKKIILEIDMKLFNQRNNAYRRLHPSLAKLVSPLLDAEDKATLEPLAHQNPLVRRLVKTATSFSSLFAMRPDIKETLYGDIDPAPKGTSAEELRRKYLKGEYVLNPLTVQNVGVRYLEKTVKLWSASGVPVSAFITPADHTRLRDYIETPTYRANRLFLLRLIEREGVRTLDLDNAFDTSAFLDEIHLTAQGQERLASILARVVSNE